MPGRAQRERDAGQGPAGAGCRAGPGGCRGAGAQGYRGPAGAACAGAQRVQGRGGSVVSIGTVLVDHALAGFPASAPAAGKAGAHALTTSRAAELTADGIRFNPVASGTIRTPLHADSGYRARADLRPGPVVRASSRSGNAGQRLARRGRVAS
ncbi:SDR family oxidoreductase [Streptomyces jumonjinensis]|uniref:SDR family oxidoreductase n=1 Tax=Streptomyces jumonjinensis TaxID=1945 RepID=UPI00331EF6BE